MKTIPKLLIILLLGTAIAGTLALKSRDGQETPKPEESPEMAAVPVPEVQPAAGSEEESEWLKRLANASNPGPHDEERKKRAEKEALPRLVDLGADKCIPCKAMAPILEGLKESHAKKFNVEFIDVWKNPEAGAKYGVRMIPTQIFYDATGKERFRHTGFYSKDDILTKWKELGIQ